MGKVQQAKERIEWIDKLKGIGIILMFLGHAVFPRELRVIIYAFHMPLFFFLSGITLNTNIDVKNFVIKRIRGILVPMISFSIIHITVYSIAYQCIIGKNISLLRALSQYPGIFLQLGHGYFEGVLWYFTCLFISEILIYFICKLPQLQQMVTVVFGVIISFLYVENIGIRLPWCIDIVFIAVMFIYLGKLCGIHKNIFEKVTRKWLFIVYMIIFICAALYNSKYYIGNETVNMSASIYGNSVLFLISAISGIMSFVSIIKNIDCKINSIQFIGRNSVIYYGLNQVLLVVPAVITYQIIVRFINIENVLIEFIIGFGYLAIALSMGYLATLFINDKMSFMLGKISKGE